MFERREVNDAFRRLMAAEVDLAEGHLRRGIPLIRWMPPELQLDVALFIHGGLAILGAIRQQNYDVWTSRPVISKGTKLRLLCRCWWELKRGRIPEDVT
jgi:phytoene/squalene synthetase